jgi:hypothetical protein
MFKTQKSSIRTISESDKDFMITDGLIVAPRAGFQISEKCPNNYGKIINLCIAHGWLKPVAYIKEQDYMWEKLCD